MEQPIKTYSEFWPFYLKEHSQPVNRWLHFFGTTLALALVGFSIASQKYEFLGLALICGYAFAWAGHFFFENNKPATFKYPVWSFISDFRMWYEMLLGVFSRRQDN